MKSKRVKFKIGSFQNSNSSRKINSNYIQNNSKQFQTAILDQNNVKDIQTAENGSILISGTHEVNIQQAQPSRALKRRASTPILTPFKKSKFECSLSPIKDSN